MVFHGTVTGPDLWNVFFEDARRAIEECFCTEVVYADDLNAYRLYPADVDSNAIETSMKNCQGELHQWGAANQVIIDAEITSDAIRLMKVVEQLFSSITQTNFQPI